MLYREIIAVCSEIHTKHINKLCGQNVKSVYVKPGGTCSDHCAVHIVTTGLYRVKYVLSVYLFGTFLHLISIARTINWSNYTVVPLFIIY